MRHLWRGIPVAQSRTGSPGAGESAHKSGAANLTWDARRPAERGSLNRMTEPAVDLGGGGAESVEGLQPGQVRAKALEMNHAAMKDMEGGKS